MTPLNILTRRRQPPRNTPLGLNPLDVLDRNPLDALDAAPPTPPDPDPFATGSARGPAPVNYDRPMDWSAFDRDLRDVSSRLAALRDPSDLTDDEEEAAIRAAEAATRQDRANVEAAAPNFIRDVAPTALRVGVPLAAGFASGGALLPLALASLGAEGIAQATETAAGAPVPTVREQIGGMAGTTIGNVVPGNILHRLPGASTALGRLARGAGIGTLEGASGGATEAVLRNVVGHGELPSQEELTAATGISGGFGGVLGGVMGALTGGRAPAPSGPFQTRGANPSMRPKLPDLPPPGPPPPPTDLVPTPRNPLDDIIDAEVLGEWPTPQPVAGRPAPAGLLPPATPPRELPPPSTIIPPAPEGFVPPAPGRFGPGRGAEPTSADVLSPEYLSRVEGTPRPEPPSGPDVDLNRMVFGELAEPTTDVSLTPRPAAPPAPAPRGPRQQPGGVVRLKKAENVGGIPVVAVDWTNPDVTALIDRAGQRIEYPSALARQIFPDIAPPLEAAAPTGPPAPRSTHELSLTPRQRAPEPEPPPVAEPEPPAPPVDITSTPDDLTAAALRGDPEARSLIRQRREMDARVRDSDDDLTAQQRTDEIVGRREAEGRRREEAGAWSTRAEGRFPDDAEMDDLTARALGGDPEAIAEVRAARGREAGRRQAEQPAPPPGARPWQQGRRVGPPLSRQARADTDIDALLRQADEQDAAVDAAARQPAEPTIEVVDEAADIQNNASGESAASVEAMNRQASMRARGETFVIVDRGGNIRPLIGPDAVDIPPGRGETKGIMRADGTFQRLDGTGTEPSTEQRARFLREQGGETAPPAPEATTQPRQRGLDEAEAPEAPPEPVTDIPIALETPPTPPARAEAPTPPPAPRDPVDALMEPPPARERPVRGHRNRPPNTEEGDWRPAGEGEVQRARFTGKDGVEKDAVEVRFPEAPSSEVRQALKEAGFTYRGPSRKWTYNVPAVPRDDVRFNTVEDAEAFVDDLLGGRPPDTPDGTPTPRKAVPRTVDEEIDNLVAPKKPEPSYIDKDGVKVYREEYTRTPDGGPTAKPEAPAVPKRTMAEGRATRAMEGTVRSNGRVITRRALVDEYLQGGGGVRRGPDGERRLHRDADDPNSGFVSESQIGKTAMDAAEAEAPAAKPTRRAKGEPLDRATVGAHLRGNPTAGFEILTDSTRTMGSIGPARFGTREHADAALDALNDAIDAGIVPRAKLAGGDTVFSLKYDGESRGWVAVMKNGDNVPVRDLMDAQAPKAPDAPEAPTAAAPEPEFLDPKAMVQRRDVAGKAAWVVDDPSLPNLVYGGSHAGPMRADEAAREIAQAKYANVWPGKTITEGGKPVEIVSLQWNDKANRMEATLSYGRHHQRTGESVPLRELLPGGIDASFDNARYQRKMDAAIEAKATDPDVEASPHSPEEYKALSAGLKNPEEFRPTMYEAGKAIVGRAVPAERVGGMVVHREAGHVRAFAITHPGTGLKMGTAASAVQARKIAQALEKHGMTEAIGALTKGTDAGRAVRPIYDKAIEAGDIIRNPYGSKHSLAAPVTPKDVADAKPKVAKRRTTPATDREPLSEAEAAAVQAEAKADPKGTVEREADAAMKNRPTDEDGDGGIGGGGGTVLGSGLGGLQTLYEKNPYLFWQTMRTVGGGLIGGLTADEDDDSVLDNIVLGAIAGGLSGPAARVLRRQAPKVFDALKDVVAPSRHVARRDLPAIRRQRAADQDIGRLDLIAWAPNKVMPDVWTKVRPVLSVLHDALDELPANAPPQMREIVRRMHVQEALGYIEHEAARARRNRHPRAERYLRSMAAELQGEPIGMQKLLGEVLTPAIARKAIRTVTDGIYHSLLGWNIGAAAANLTQNVLAAPYTGARSLANGILEAMTKKGRSDTSFLVLNRRPMDQAQEREFNQWVENYLDLSHTPMRWSDSTNRRVTYLAAKQQATERYGAPEHDARAWALDVTEQVQGVPGDLGANPLLRSLGPMRALIRYPLLWLSLMDDLARHPDPAVKMRALGLFSGAGALTYIAGVNAMDYLVPRMQAPPAFRGAIDVAQHGSDYFLGTALADHDLAEHADPTSTENSLFPVYPTKVANVAGRMAEHGMADRDIVNRSGRRARTITAKEDLQSVLSYTPAARAAEREQESQQYGFAAKARQEQTIANRKARRRAGQMMASGDRSGAMDYLIQQGFTNQQRREFLREYGRSPTERARRATPRRRRDEFDEMFGLDEDRDDD